MKMNKLMAALVMTMGVASFGANAGNVGAGKVTFKGAILDAPCSITPGTSDQEVKLGQVSQSTLANQGRSIARGFEIQLENCDATAVGKTVSITFEGVAAGTEGGDENLLALSGANGAGVAIVNAVGGAPIVLGKENAIRKIVNGNNMLSFSAYLQGLTGVENIEPGEFTSIADFVMTYK